MPPVTPCQCGRLVTSKIYIAGENNSQQRLVVTGMFLTRQHADKNHLHFATVLMHKEPRIEVLSFNSSHQIIAKEETSESSNEA